MVITPTDLNGTEKNNLIREYRKYVYDKMKMGSEDVVSFLANTWRQSKKVHWMLDWIVGPHREGIMVSVEKHYEEKLIGFFVQTPMSGRLTAHGEFAVARRYQQKFKSTQKQTEIVKMLKNILQNDGRADEVSTVMNFWFVPPGDRRFDASPTKKIMLMGHEFPFPEIPESLLWPLQDEFE